MTIFKAHNLPYKVHELSPLRYKQRDNWAIQLDDGSRLYGAWDKQDLINRVAAEDLPELKVVD